MIDLNSKDFDSKASSIFNGGDVGIVDNVILKGAVETNPERGYEVQFEKDGGMLRHFVNYFNENDPAANPIKRAVGIQLKHMVVALYGKNQPLPTANNMHELIGACMKMVNAKAGTKVRLHTNFGLKTSPQKYIRVHKYSPFMELMNTNPSELKEDNRFIYERPAAEPVEADNNVDLGESTTEISV